MNRKEEKIKILFFLSNLSGGGAQRTMVNLLRGLDRNKFKPSLALLNYDANDAYANLMPPDIEVININSRGRFAAWKIKKLIESMEPDILFSTLPQVNFAVWLGNKLSNKPGKLVLRETNYREIGFNTTSILQMLYKKMYRDADKVIALSEGVKNHMFNTYKLEESTITRIYNPVDVKKIKELSEDKCDVDYTKKFKLVACGRLAKQKNYPLLINALGILKEKGYSEFELFIMGTGPDEKAIEEMIISKGLNENIKLIGFQNNPYAYMEKADLFILSSLWEGFGHVIVEAMACGTPVVSTDCPHGPSEILENGKYGWLVPNDDLDKLTSTLSKLMSNPNEIMQMANKVRVRAKEFDVQYITREYEEVFSQMKRI